MDSLRKLFFKPQEEESFSPFVRISDELLTRKITGVRLSGGVKKEPTMFDIIEKRELQILYGTPVTSVDKASTTADERPYVPAAAGTANIDAYSRPKTSAPKEGIPSGRADSPLLTDV